MKVAFCGLSHLGVCMSIAAHRWGIDVLGFDLSSERVDKILLGAFDAAEPDVAEFLKSNPDKFRVSSDASDLRDADLLFVAVDTRLDDSGENDESEVSQILRAVTKVVSPKTPVVIASQVRPGFTRNHTWLHESLFYLMETLIFGEGVSRATRPERYVVGAPEPHQVLPTALDRFLQFANCPIHVMSYESAELTKLAANFVLAANITAANSLAEIAELVGADWGQIEPALREDSRIGPRAYISAGLGLGGSNLSRDLFGLMEMAERRGANAELAKTLLHHSNYMRNWLVRTLLRVQRAQQLDSIALLGLSYKPGTASTRNSAGMEVLEVFSAHTDILVHDPSATLPAHHRRGRVHQCDTELQALRASSVVVIATPHPQYRETMKSFLKERPKVLILDPFRTVATEWVLSTQTELIQLGVSFGS